MFATRALRATTRLAVVATNPMAQKQSIVISQSMSRINYRYFSDAPAGEAAPAAEGGPKEGEKKDDAASQVQKLEAEVKNLKDQLLRAYAESENTRRIAQRDVENARQYSTSSFAKALLEVADDLDRALSTVPPEKRKTGDVTFDNLIIGIEMTEKNMQKVLRQFGVVKFAEVGEKFDPNLHDALFQVPPNEDRKEDTIANIIKHGYKIKDRVLRPAQVGACVKQD